MNGNFDTEVDTTLCKECNGVADIVEGEHGYYVSCSLCGRTTKKQYGTIDEAVSAFKDDGEVEHQ